MYKFTLSEKIRFINFCINHYLLENEICICDLFKIYCDISNVLYPHKDMSILFPELRNKINVNTPRKKYFIASFNPFDFETRIKFLNELKNELLKNYKNEKNN